MKFFDSFLCIPLSLHIATSIRCIFMLRDEHSTTTTTTEEMTRRSSEPTRIVNIPRHSFSHAATFLFIFTAPSIHIAFNNVINVCHCHIFYILYIFAPFLSWLDFYYILFACCRSPLSRLTTNIVFDTHAMFHVGRMALPRKTL